MNQKSNQLSTQLVTNQLLPTQLVTNQSKRPITELIGVIPDPTPQFIGYTYITRDSRYLTMVDT